MKKFSLQIIQLYSVSLLVNLLGFGPVFAQNSQEVIKDERRSRNAMSQINSVSQLSDVQPTDWAFQALQSLVERYGVIAGYADGTFRGNRALTRYEFAAGLNTALNRINELIAASQADLVRKEDLATLRRLQQDFASELAMLRGRVDALEANVASLEANQFSTTTRLNAEVIWAVTDTFGDRVGGDDNAINTYAAYRTRLQFETSFTGEDLLRTRLEVSNFDVANVTDTTMTLANFATGTFQNDVVIPHILYSFPISSTAYVVLGPTGIGYTDVTDTLTPPTIADDSIGVPSLVGEYNPFYRQGGGGAAVNWRIRKDLVLTLGYLALNPDDPSEGEGLFDGKYNSLAQLAYYGDWGAVGVAYSLSYAPRGRVDTTAGAGSALARQPFGDDIAISTDTVSLQGFYRVAPKFHIHGWVAYVNASAKSSGLSNLSDGRGGELSVNVPDGSNADIWYGAIGLTFPDVGGEGNLPGLVFALPPRVTNSDVRDEPDSSYHIEGFYRFLVNDNISITPGFWVVLNPENDSSNDTQYVGIIRTSFDF